MYTNQIDNFHQFGKNKTSSLIGVYENMSNIFKTSEHNTRLHRNTLQSQTATSKILRKPTHSLSLPRKPSSNSQLLSRKDNILPGKNCDPNFIAANKNEDINNPTLPKSYPPYYCPPLNKSTSMNKCPIKNDIQNGNYPNPNMIAKDIKEQNHLKGTQQVFKNSNTQASNSCYESNSELQLSAVKGIWKNGLTRDHSITNADNTERFHQKSSEISITTQKQINRDSKRNDISVTDFNSSNKINLNTSHDTELGSTNETSMVQGDFSLNPKMKLNKPINKQRQIQLQLQQNPQTRQLFAVIQEEVIK